MLFNYASLSWRTAESAPYELHAVVPGGLGHLPVVGKRFHQLRESAVGPMWAGPGSLRPATPGQPKRGMAGVAGRCGAKERPHQPDEPAGHPVNLLRTIQ